MRKLIIILLFIPIISSCSNDNDDDPCPCAFTLSSVSGIETENYYVEITVSMPNPCDSYLDQYVDSITQLYENDGTFENPVKGLNQVGNRRTASILFTSVYLNALNSGVGSTFLPGGGQSEHTVQEYNCN